MIDPNEPPRYDPRGFILSPYTICDNCGRDSTDENCPNDRSYAFCVDCCGCHPA